MGELVQVDDIAGFRWVASGGGYGALFFNEKKVLSSCTEFAARCYVTGFTGRQTPDFVGFAASLRAEAQWSAQIHRNPNDPSDAGQSLQDQRALNELADRVEKVGRRLGWISELDGGTPRHPMADDGSGPTTAPGDDPS
ncbi:MAG: hypothetical protein K0U16_07635 [Gammaproteobacteria bacterium]|nr:hypothetical protein [Gammaproteobacteria bacterium]